MLYINNYNRDEDNAAYVSECMAQRARLETVRVLEAEIMTLEEIAEHAEDYESWMEDVDFIRHGGA